MLIKNIKFLVLPAVFLVLLGCNNKSELIWEEDFTDSELNMERWQFELGDGCPELCGWGNEEPQLYTKKNHRLENGNLIITVKSEDSLYTSTRITTKNKFEFKYGRLETRAKLPTGTGVWPAIWMLGSNIDEVKWPMSGEIDILEYVGREPHMIFNSLHTDDSHGETINTKKTRIENIEEGFHTYAMNWTAEKIEFFVDGKKLYTFNPEQRTEEIWPFDQPFYILVNMAIGGGFGGPTIDDSILPQEFIVDYIRVYSN